MAMSDGIIITLLLIGGENSMIILSIFFALIVLFLSGRNLFSDENKRKIICQDECFLNENIVRYHSVYLKEGMIGVTAISIVACGIILLNQMYTALIVPFLFMVFSYGNLLLNYKNFWMTYDKNGITIQEINARSQHIDISDICSVESTYKDKFWTRGRTVKIVIIKYHLPQARVQKQLCITLYYSYQIGIDRFLAFWDQYK